jgi:hypothetical protein
MISNWLSCEQRVDKIVAISYCAVRRTPIELDTQSDGSEKP